MKFNRKGLSDVVTTVLIILLVLAAVVIVWSFVRPAIQRGAGGVGGQTDCIQMQIVPVNCKVTTDVGGNKDVDVTVKHNGGDINSLEGGLVIFHLSDQTTKTRDLINEPTVFASISSKYEDVLSSGATQTIDKVSFAAKVRSETGEVVTCVQTAPIACS